MEFGGVYGTLLLTLVLPALVVLLNLQCGKESCDLFHFPSLPSGRHNYLNETSVLIVLGWFLFQVVLAILPTGQVLPGIKLKTGKHLKYRCNGFQASVISLIAVLLLIGAGFPVYLVYRNFFQIAVTAIIFSFLLGVFLYVKSLFAPKEELAAGGQTGYVPYDFFLGRELNPRIGSLDLKFFCELRPGLIGWVMLDIAMLHEAYVTLGVLPLPLLFVVIFHSLYVLDALYHEEAILTTMDITEEGFGFMLAFGDLAWVPFLYCLQARYLLEHSIQVPLPLLLVIVFINVVGYFIFRLSNSQKNLFRKDPNNPKVAHLETIPTATGKKLLVSGWWGMCRHPNYLGDLMMALSWSLTCGFGNLLPYFYPIYFTILLVHREIRDSANCHKKYGADWVKYCKRVPYRIFPYLY